MKIYVHIDITALGMLYTECKERHIDITLTIVHSEKYGDYAVISSYYPNLEIIRLIDKVGLKEKKKGDK